MGEDVYNNCFNDYRLFKCDINLSSFKVSCLSVDLAKFSSVSYDTHNRDTDVYFFNMINYIKENRLYIYGDVMAILYGSICHYCLDVYTHPLIYYISYDCLKTGIISPHNLTEGYISSYMLERKNITDSFNYIGDINFNNLNIINVLDYTYDKTYNYSNIINIYRLTFDMVKLLEKCVSNFNKEMLIKVSRFNKFLEVNNLTRNEIVNEDNLIWSNLITGEKFNYSFMELYNMAIIRAYDVIYLVNRYIYDNVNVDLAKLFTNLSYDTGVSISLGRSIKYVRKMQGRRRKNYKRTY